MIYQNVLQLIGNTPLVKINRLNPNPQNTTILAKLDYLNPGGSLKDRIALKMISAAEKKGQLKQGGTVVEATSGNTGISLAMVAAVKGYKTIFTQPDLMSNDKTKLLEALGAKVVKCITRVPINDPRGYKTTAKRIAQAKKAFLTDQYSNKNNPQAHFETSGPEIWRDTQGKLDYIVIGIGTGGTATGTVKFLKKKNKKIKFIAPDPIGSVYSGKLGPFFVEGIGHIFIPKNVDLSLVDKFVRLESKAAIATAKLAARKEGLIVGPSGGAALYAAIETAKKIKRAKRKQIIVAFIPDSGERYLDYLYDEDFEVPLATKVDTKKGFATKAIHAHTQNFQTNNALVPPTHRSAIFKFNRVKDVTQIFAGGNKNPDNRSKFLYARGNHPNQRQLELTVASLEGGSDALAFSSGMAAITSLGLQLLSQGDQVVAGNMLYGESFAFFSRTIKKWGIKTTFVNPTKPSQIKKAINQKTKLVYLETPTNPLLDVIDIEAIAQITKQQKTLLVIDNTFATAYLQQPLKLGADVVVLSSTKYLSGHSDALGGLVVAQNQDLILDLWETLFVTGAVIDPQAASLTQRGIKTLSLRMERHCQNAHHLAKYLSQHPKVKKVHYPGLLSHPQHDIARTQMTGFGGIISFELKGSQSQAEKFIDQLKLFSISVSLGAVHSLVNLPAKMTHSMIPKRDRLKAGLSDSLIRFSVGIEDVEDLIDDINQAFKKI